jgi:stress response protein YsnF
MKKNKDEDGLLKCSKYCVQHKICCEENNCRLWIDFEKEQNCSLISVYQNGRMTLRETAERLGISFARVKQIETKALKKLKKRTTLSGLLF